MSTVEVVILAASPVLIPECIRRRTKGWNLMFLVFLASSSMILTSLVERNRSRPGPAGTRSMCVKGLPIDRPQAPLASRNILDSIASSCRTEEEAFSARRVDWYREISVDSISLRGVPAPRILEMCRLLYY